MKIGLGITTTAQRDIHPSVLANTHSSILIHVHTDTDGVGVAKSRNNAIKYLYDHGCDYIAIIDDDVEILRPGALEYAVLIMSGMDIPACGLPNPFTTSMTQINEDLIRCSDWIGCLHIFSRQFIDDVGYFCTEFDRYGYEDAHMQHRIKLKYGSLLCPSRLPFYYLSQDVYGQNPTPSIPNAEKARLVESNRSIFIKHVESNQIYYPYEQEYLPGNQ